jgi:hypothetical protein
MHFLWLLLASGWSRGPKDAMAKPANLKLLCVEIVIWRCECTYFPVPIVLGKLLCRAGAAAGRTPERGAFRACSNISPAHMII